MANITGTNENDIINTTTAPASTAAADQISGRNGDDQIRGGGGNDQIHGDNGIDQLWGDTGDDRLSGDNGNDILDGGADKDILDGGRGDDVMTGGPGADTFVLSQGNDRITDFSPTVTTPLLIDFEGLRSPVPDGYRGLDWTNFHVNGRISSSSSGYTNVLNSGELVGFDAFGLGASFTSTQDFNLNSGYFAAAWSNDLTLTIQAWDDGVQVGTATIVLDITKAFVNFQAGTATGVDSASFSGRFDSIDEVRMDGTGGTDADGIVGGPGGGSGDNVAVDDLLLGFPGGDGDVIDVPAGTNVAALIAGATSNGTGSTVLNGGLTLEHTNPGDVSASWFV